MVPAGKIPLEDGTAKLLPVLVITPAYSRFVTGRMIPTRKTEDLLLGSWELIQQLGRVPRRLIWDNEPGIGRGKRHAVGVDAFMGTLATKLVLLPPRIRSPRVSWSAATAGSRPRSCPAGRSPHRRTSTSSSRDWLERANRRVVRTIEGRAGGRLDADRAAMLPLPPIPLHLGWRNRIRLGRDYYVRLDTNDYSVDPRVIGRIVDVTADLDRVRVRATAGSSPIMPGSGRGA